MSSLPSLSMKHQCETKPLVLCKCAKPELGDIIDKFQNRCKKCGDWLGGFCKICNINVIAVYGSCSICERSEVYEERRLINPTKS